LDDADMTIIENTVQHLPTDRGAELDLVLGSAAQIRTFASSAEAAAPRRWCHREGGADG